MHGQPGWVVALTPLSAEGQDVLLGLLTERASYIGSSKNMAGGG